MKMLIVVAFALVAVTIAAPPASPEVDEVVKSEFNSKPDGSYSSSFETKKGLKRNDEAELKEVLDEDNKPKLALVVRGSYSYVDPEGNVETVNYLADEKGYQPEGPSIPKGPTSGR